MVCCQPVKLAFQQKVLCISCACCIILEFAGVIQRLYIASLPVLSYGGKLLLAAQIATRTEYDKVIQETEGAYIKILESSQTLLTVLKRESVSIQKKRQTSS